MAQIPILSGIYADKLSDFRTALPRNLIPVPKDNGISAGYLRPADGLVAIGLGPGNDRGAINWNGLCYRVMGSKLCVVDANGGITQLGDVGGSVSQCSMAYSFDRLAIVSDNRVFYWDGSALSEVTDPDLGSIIDIVWVDGYFMMTDGEFLIVTDLNDPTAINPLKYGSAEANPDPILSLIKIRNEVYALGRHTVEVFQNVGGTNFPFQRITGAQLERGTLGTHCSAKFDDALVFLGGSAGDSGTGEPPAIWMGMDGQTEKLSIREVDQILSTIDEATLANVTMDTRTEASHRFLYVHLPEQTLVYDGGASAELERPIWFTLDSGDHLGRSAYLARNFVYCYGKWIFGNPLSAAVGIFSRSTSTHYDTKIGWEFSTPIIYNEGMAAQIHDLELVGLPGRLPTDDIPPLFGIVLQPQNPMPVIGTAYSLDGETWSQERVISAGQRGERTKRLIWRQQGILRNYRMQRFRGTSDAHISFARLEARVEPLNA